MGMSRTTLKFAVIVGTIIWYPNRFMVYVPCLVWGPTAMSYKSISTRQVMDRSKVTKERQHIEKCEYSCPECF